MLSIITGLCSLRPVHSPGTWDDPGAVKGINV